MFRRGLGDLFVGLLYTMEASVPFVAIRAILQTSGQHHYQRSKLYFVNQILLTVVYFIVRIAVWPFIYWLYAHQVGLKISQVIFKLHVYCHLGTLGQVSQ